jgi:hypothetical protein
MSCSIVQTKNSFDKLKSVVEACVPEWFGGSCVRVAGFKSITDCEQSQSATACQMVIHPRHTESHSCQSLTERLTQTSAGS